MSFEISLFNTANISRLETLPPEDWNTNALELFLHNEWQPWFFPFQATINNDLVGFGMYFLFEEYAWLGWIIVHSNYRNRGIGTAITNFLIENSRAKGAKSFILTATEMGKPIYEKLGFKTTSYYQFFKTPEIFSPICQKGNIHKAAWTDLEQILKLDLMATGEKRSALIENNLDEGYIYRDKDIEGFYFPKLGNGFIVANNPKAGTELIKFRYVADKRNIVVPCQNKAAINFLLRNKFICGSLIPRMTLGEVPKWNQRMIFNRAAGYCG